MGTFLPYHEPVPVKKRPYCAKVYFSGQALVDVRARAQKAGFHSIGLYLKGFEADGARLLAIREAQIEGIVHIIRLYHVSRDDLARKGVMI